MTLKQRVERIEARLGIGATVERGEDTAKQVATLLERIHARHGETWVTSAQVLDLFEGFAGAPVTSTRGVHAVLAPWHDTTIRMLGSPRGIALQRAARHHQAVWRVLKT